ncbi:helix-turn-helix transcriptional regulator [Lacimicrobium sp. SS2-24]|uniref:helix-turn-helix transcriptional regulator n=1 Tax=Lacimicrobium sp. SS2-24 TaxID=2005569 RepID=UPI000B4B0872|nr:helix-turn-helix transcriptional regulator [Lacimicrobium sp. SS2-24]
MTQLYTLQLLIGLGLLLAQLGVKNKQPLHLLFALFCGSISMVAVTRLNAEVGGQYEFLLAMGGFATCNGYWLVSRALHRGQAGLTTRHYAVAGAVGVMIVLSNALSWSQQEISHAFLQDLRLALSEFMNLASSTLIVLSAWEGCRGLHQSKGAELMQRIVYLASFCGAVITCSVVVKLIGQGGEGEVALHNMMAAICAIQLMLVTQWLIYWQRRSTMHTSEPESSANTNRSDLDENDVLLAQEITRRLEQQQHFLKPNLRVSDLAWLLDVPEYRVSRVMREQLNAQNFNHYVNRLRVEYARGLLEDPANQHWPIVVIGLESGFASVGPFTRAFKSEYGQTPNQYRLTYTDKTGESGSLA